MRAKRSKNYRKLMQAYQMTFNFREPYQVLLTADFTRTAASFKMRLGHLLQRTLHGEIKPMITQCCIRHLYNAEVGNSDAEKKEKEEWIAVAKQAERRRCGHHELEQPLSELECLMSVVDPKGGGTNRHKYIIATQDIAVRAKMRRIPGTPLVYLNRSVMLLEPMAGSSEEVRNREEKAKIRAGLKGARDVAGGKRKRLEEEVENEQDGSQDEQPEATEQQAPKKKKVKGPKGPNPLSAKKSKKERSDPRAEQSGSAAGDARNLAQQEGAQADGEGVTEGPKKRKRKRKPADDAETSAIEAAT